MGENKSDRERLLDKIGPDGKYVNFPGTEGSSVTSGLRGQDLLRRHRLPDGTARRFGDEALSQSGGRHYCPPDENVENASSRLVTGRRGGGEDVLDALLDNPESVDPELVVLFKEFLRERYEISDLESMPKTEFFDDKALIRAEFVTWLETDEAEDVVDALIDWEDLESEKKETLKRFLEERYGVDDPSKLPTTDYGKVARGYLHRAGGVVDKPTKTEILIRVNPITIQGTEGYRSYETFCELWGQDGGRVIYVRMRNPDDDVLVLAKEFDGDAGGGNGKKHVETRIKVRDLADAVILGGETEDSSSELRSNRPQWSDRGRRFFDVLGRIVLYDQTTGEKSSLGEKEFVLQIVGPDGKQTVKAKPTALRKVGVRGGESLVGAITEGGKTGAAEANIRWIPINPDEAVSRSLGRKEGMGDLLKYWEAGKPFVLEFQRNNGRFDRLILKGDEGFSVLVSLGDLFYFLGARNVSPNGDRRLKGERGFYVWDEKDDKIVPGMSPEQILEVVKRWRFHGVPCPDGVEVKVRELAAK